MKAYIFLSLFIIEGIFSGVFAHTRINYKISTVKELNEILSIWHDSVNIILNPGEYHLTPNYDIDTGICSKRGKGIAVKFSYGLKIKGRYIKISASEKFGSMIITDAGYGLFFESCKYAVVQGLIITGGKRDLDSMATDAAIVVKGSHVDIINNDIFDNIGDENSLKQAHQGIMGICIRENGEAYISENQIGHNTGNGISVLANGSATIINNLVDGVDTYYQNDGYRRFYQSTIENVIDGGRGIGILFTRNAKGSVLYSMIKRYRCGIGIYVNANVSVQNNVIENIKNWEICVWDADSGQPVARIDRNVIFKTGACGVGLICYQENEKGQAGYLTNNIFVETAQDIKNDAPDKFCFQCALAIHAIPQKFEVSHNAFYLNRWLSPCSSDQDMRLPDFMDVLRTRFASLPSVWFSQYSEFVQGFFDAGPGNQKVTR